MTQLETQFQSNNILYASELNAIIDKINEIIRNFPSSTGGGVTQEELDKKIKDATDRYKDLLGMAEDRLSGRLALLELASPTESTDWIQIFKDILRGENGQEIMKGVLFRMGLTDEEGTPYFDATIQHKIDGYDNRISTLEILPGQMSLLVERRNGQNVIKAANIISAITDENGNLVSSVNVSADQILLDGDVSISNTLSVANNLASGNGTFTGNVEAKSFKVMNGSAKTIEFTTATQELKTQYPGIADSGIATNAPIGLVYMGSDTPVYFFDFAPVDPGTFSATEQLLYYISGASSGTGKVDVQVGPIYFYVTDSNDSNYHKYITSPRANGIKVSSITAYKKDSTYTAFISRLGQSGHYIQSVTLYKQVSFLNGEMSYTGQAYLVSSPMTGYNLTSYTSESSSSTVYKDAVYLQNDTNVNMSMLLSSSYNVHCLQQASDNNSSDSFIVGIMVNGVGGADIADQDLLS